MISVYVTFKDREEAVKVARILLKKRLVACANLFPVDSFFWWKGEVVDGSEFAMIAKAPKENFEHIREEVRSIHSYDVPCVVAWSVSEKEDEFFKWVQEEASGRRHA
ncbi:divalent-cation tolerance protein CutA [Candidatus Woesearchaeota archaeon]|nr:divalent-cation tolerance protein CutA [Candidatus Woesearchaeota archaeon]